MCVCKHEGHRQMLEVFLYLHSPYFLRQGISLNLEFSVYVVVVGQKHLGIHLCTPPTSVGATDIFHHVWLIRGDSCPYDYTTGI